MYKIFPHGLFSQDEIVPGVGNSIMIRRKKLNNPIQPEIVNLVRRGTVRNLKAWSQGLTCSKGREARRARKAGSWRHLLFPSKQQTYCGCTLEW